MLRSSNTLRVMACIIDRNFETAEDVEAMPGVDKAMIEHIKTRLFGRLRNDQ